jgi:hypothetical protein
MANCKLILITAAFSTILLWGCGQGSDASVNQGATKANEPINLSENDAAYTVVVGEPFVGPENQTWNSTIYGGLYTNLTSSVAQGKFPISRVLLTIVPPADNSVFNIDNLKSSFAIGFLKALLQYNKTSTSPIQVYAYPDVEADSNWLKFSTVASQYPSIASCAEAVNSKSNISAQTAMLMSICWASVVNLFIDPTSSIISGVAYDQQSNWLQDDLPSPTTWLYPKAHGDGLLLGWASAKGIQAGTSEKVDLNLIEVYDLNSNKNPAYDALVAATAMQHFAPNPPIAPVCQGILCAYDYSSAYPSGNGSYKKFFPGTQYATDPKAGPVIPVVGANIYQCALSSGSSSFGCNSEYVSNVDTLKPNYVQVMQAINYVWTTVSKLTPTAAYYGTTPGASLSGNVVYLFSTQYAGPVQSYSDFNKLQPPISSHTLCTDPTTPSAQQCSCLASAYNSSASCGDENSFGTWGAYFSDFKLFQALFFTTQGGTACPGASCSAGIYMYDYIPQVWYQ